MEDKLRKLFDYQRFAGNLRLQDVINETERRYSEGEALSDDDMFFVAAAGTPEGYRPPKNDDVI